ncbi:NAD(P)-dependent alcohol dehydrogenase [Myxococcus llanfairpwllgwyngyllgogerychwyrndrobwllllantysiliogogogochensis]|uniref:NAD(P)-dependent alcohol dehydrogenase n=1 Tax=Myxococcus llanfairpwllgwyngyllgogerychwyrndrobwllllantysiliogogogochensis TaxID=2590453 RepID=A0A540X082_9BACT|nr:NAD(P)-dependent alcohol dehydrogenase [Myxococcus llanfairpwllgwyngyllgogerychwyrndrobwllllantysiliogogogochensis]TQF14144.1 NAD(P)-dependent alcohol dehydrogenase [Myxococcus llanfairpwllgwyngyllgogerychwyrndrobwllllantysiliogogogochensis]
MRAYEIRGGFGLDKLVLGERPDPEPGPFQVRVRVKATSLNYRDLMMVEGRYNPRQKLPLIPNSDGAGVVDAVGQGVTRVKQGDRVMGLFSQAWPAGEPTRTAQQHTLGGPLDGALGDTMVLHEDGVMLTPAYLSDEEAATLPCAALTAWSALVTYGALKAGDVVLLQGTGGVSIFALQIAKLLGARVIITSSRDDKLERARALGAHDLINYVTTPDWDKAARALTGNAGVDHVVEVGGAGTFEKSLRAVRPGGTVSVIGVLSGGSGAVPLTSILMQNLRVQGILVGHRQGFEALVRAFSQHSVRPVVDRVFAFDEAVAAFHHLKSGAHFGKVVVRVG